MRMTTTALLLLSLAGPAGAQFTRDPAAEIAAQKLALDRLKYMDGTWRGVATTLLPDGGKRTITQTERIGPFLGGTIRAIEGRGYDDTGAITFNAFGVISFDTAKKAYSMRSWAQGHAGEFPVRLKDDGYVWEIPAGPGMVRYDATVKDGTWHEVGDHILPGKPPTRFFEMRLKRLGDTDWPDGGAVPPG